MLQCVCRYTRLAVVPDNTPLPMTMLRKLWQLSSEQEAEECCYRLQQLSILRIAQLYDGSSWALVDATHLKDLQVHCHKLHTYSGLPVYHCHHHHDHHYPYNHLVIELGLHKCIAQVIVMSHA